VIKRIKKELKKLQKGNRGGMTVGSHAHSHSVPGGGHQHTGVTQGHTHAVPSHNHNLSSTSMPFHDPSAGFQEESYEWFHKVFCPCGSIDWIEVSQVFAWSHVKNSNITRKLVVCKECEKVTIIDDHEITEQREPVRADDKFEFFEKLKELRIEFDQSQYPRTTTITHSTTTSTSTTPPPPPRGQP